MTRSFTDIEQSELNALIERVQDAKRHDLTLSPDDCQLLIDALLTLAELQSKLEDNRVTLGKLRKLMGIVASSESLKKQVAGGQEPSHSTSGKPRNTGEKPKAPPLKPEVHQHALEEVKRGDTCPKCQQGKLRKYEPATLLRIRGQSPFVPEQHVMERVRCNACGTYFTANLPDEVLADGKPDQKYGNSARTLMALGKCYMGSPYYRQGSLQDLLGVSVSASTVFDQVEHLANAVFPVFKLLKQHAAGAIHYRIDDTTQRILNQQPISKPSRDGKGMKQRTGVYCSGLIAELSGGERIVLFQTDIGHAGEFIDSILQLRPAKLAPPTVMSDALSSNTPTVCPAEQALCNAHARRQLYDLRELYPEIDDLLLQYAQIWHNQREVEAQKLDPTARLKYHQQHSLPVMVDIRRQCEQGLNSGDVEANSSLGKAMAYYLKHYNGLTAFCRLPGVAIDNNLMEAQLKLVVRNRKNAMFYRTLAGASVADVVTSLIATAIQAGVNLFDYFNRLQREQEQVKAHPERYLPWVTQEKAAANKAA